MILLTIVAKLVIGSIVLFGYYWLFLRNKRFHRYNRYYLVLTVIITMLLPFLSVPVPASDASAGLQAVMEVIAPMDWQKTTEASLPAAGIESQNAKGIGEEQVLVIVYVLVAMVMLYMLVRALLYVHRIRKRYAFEKLGRLHLYQTNEPGTPFSFFRSIFWNRELPLDSHHGQQIFRHEVYHVEQKHSYDILLLEIACVVCWFNPVFFLIKKELRAIHEFLADQHSITNDDRVSYAEMLLMESIRTRNNGVVHPFFHSQIKRRIAMIMNYTDKKYGFASRIIALPIALFLFCFISVKAQEQVPDLNVPVNTITDAIVTIQPGSVPQRDTVKSSAADLEKFLSAQSALDNAPFESMITDTRFYWHAKESRQVYYITIEEFDVLANKYQYLKELKENRKVFVKSEINAEYPGGRNAWIRYVKANAQTPVDASGKRLSGVVEIQFQVDQEGNLSEIVYKAGNESLAEEAMRLIKNGGKWSAAIQNGRKVRSYKIESITFDREKGTVYPTPPMISLTEYQPPVMKRVDVEAQYPGGLEGWRNYIMANLKYPEAAIEKKLEGTVVVRFIVGIDGTISDVKAIKGDAVLAPEAVRVIKESGKWLPSKLKGRNVRAYRMQPILFRLDKDAKAHINPAINNGSSRNAR